MPRRITWSNPIKVIRPGEPVSADVTNRPDREIAERVQALRNRLLDQGGNLVIFEQDVDSTTSVGDAVYFNKTTNKFERALATTQVVDGRIAPADSADVLGIISTKHSGGIADIVLLGLDTELVLRDESDSETPTDGAYYLSGTLAGRVTLVPPSTPIRVATYDSGLGTVVAIDRPTSFDQHRHYRFDLDSLAAANETVFLEGGLYRVALTGANSTLPGWLPADDAIFDGNAPEGAYFGYNLSRDDDLRAVWPPSPPDAASIVVFFDDRDGFGMELPQEYVTFDVNGIWLKTNVVAQLPWWVRVSAGGSSSSAGPFGDGAGRERQAAIYFHRSRYAADRTAVTSLTPQDPLSPIKIVDCNGVDATVGDLFLKYDPDTVVETDTDLSAIAVKEFLDGGRIKRGPVAVLLVPGDDTIILESDDSQPVDANLPLGDRGYYGIVRIRAALDASERLIPPQIVHLNGVQQRYSSEIFLSLGLKANTSLTFKFVLPGPVGFPSNPKATLRLWLEGGAATSVPDLTIAARRLPRALVPTVLPVSSETMDFESPGIIPVGSYMEVETTEITALTVEAADVVTVTVSRAPSDGYAGELQILNAWLRLYEGS